MSTEQAKPNFPLTSFLTQVLLTLTAATQSPPRVTAASSSTSRRTLAMIAATGRRHVATTNHLTQVSVAPDSTAGQPSTRKPCGRLTRVETMGLGRTRRGSGRVILTGGRRARALWWSFRQAVTRVVMVGLQPAALSLS